MYVLWRCCHDKQGCRPMNMNATEYEPTFSWEAFHKGKPIGTFLLHSRRSSGAKHVIAAQTSIPYGQLTVKRISTEVQS